MTASRAISELVAAERLLLKVNPGENAYGQSEGLKRTRSRPRQYHQPSNPREQRSSGNAGSNQRRNSGNWPRTESSRVNHITHEDSESSEWDSEEVDRASDFSNSSESEEAASDIRETRSERATPQDLPFCLRYLKNAEYCTGRCNKQHKSRSELTTQDVRRLREAVDHPNNGVTVCQFFRPGESNQCYAAKKCPWRHIADNNEREAALQRAGGPRRRDAGND